ILQGAVGAVAAIGALLSGLASIILAVAKLRAERVAPPQGEKLPDETPPTRKARSSPFVALLKKPLFLCGVLLLILAGNLFVWYVWRPDASTNERLTAAAWEALDKADYAEAEAKARECIREFEGEALREQQALEARGDAPPPVGPVGEAEKERIFARGPLNDVGTSYFILGKALEARNRREEAAQAYSAALNFPYARYWDPRGWFNSPADAARDRLKTLGIENAPSPVQQD
ncbi:MAG TPA: hypothetical protein VGV59_06330, partial [Pyrinomonadaceae bacterium]|nr:hypothetical protein [Pyrinomonadaceae bacterium]